MCCNFPTIKITEGNAFTLIFPLKRRSYVAEKPIDEDIDVTRLTDVRVTLGGVEYTPTIETYGVRIDVPATLVRGTYDGLLTADYDGNAIRGAYESCVQIVAWNAQSNAQQYILGSPVATKAAYVLGYMPTDEEVESLKQQLREQIEAAERAEAEAIAEKEHYAEAVEQLDDLARQGNNPNATNTQILYDINHLVVPPPTGVAQEQTLTNGIAALQNAITALYGGDSNATLSALKTAIAEISIDTDDLAKADALAAVQSDIDALQVLVGTTADTSTDATIFGKLAAVLAAVAGISGFATPTDVANAQAAIIAAMPSVSGLATEINATSNKQAILDAIAALSIPTVQQIQAGLALDSTVAKESTLGTTADSGVATTIFGWLKAIWDKLVGIVTTYPYAKEATLTDAANGLPAIKSLASSAATDAAAAKTAAQGITGYALQGNDATATNTAILQAIPSVAGLATESNATANKNEVLAAIAANAGIPTLTIPDSTASQELAPNVLYIFDNRTSTLTLTLGTPVVGIANEYHFFIVCGSTAPTVNFPSGITWNGGSAPTIAADKTYEVSILNNVAAYFEV